MADFDETDRDLIELLQKDARTPQAQLAAQVGLAASSVNERIRKLGERGLIVGYHAEISAEAMGFGAVFGLLADLQDKFGFSDSGLGLIAASA